MGNEFSKRYEKIKAIVDDEEKFNAMSLSEMLEFQKEVNDTMAEYKNLELVVKRDANSLYGTTGSKFFSLGDFDCAEDITQTGKHYAVLVDRKINEFFVNWGEKELKIIQQFYPQCSELRKFTEYKPDTVNDLCVYGDTDSRYIDLAKIYELLNIPLPANTPEGNQELADFGVFLMDNFINAIIKNSIETDIEYRNAVKGRLKMAHEITTRRSILLKKKKYIMNAIWKDGKVLGKNKITYKGVEIKQGTLSSKIKKIIQVVLEKFINEQITEEEVRLELIKLISHLKKLRKKSYVYKISSVSGLDNIRFENNKYVSDKKHIQIQMALFWYNFLHENKLTDQYKLPFEKQKMYFYYSWNERLGKNFVVAVPDDVDIETVPNLPEPNWNYMFNQILVKPLIKYVKNKHIDKITDQMIDNFILGVKTFESL